MKLKFAFGIFPYLLFSKKLKGKYGTTKGPVVFVDPNTSNPTTVEHEEVHVAIWYCVTLLCTPLILWPMLFHYTFNIPLLIVAISFAGMVDALLGQFFKGYKKHEEAFAYGRSYYLAEDPEAYLSHYRKGWIKTYGKDFESLVRHYSKFFED